MAKASSRSCLKESRPSLAIPRFFHWNQVLFRARLQCVCGCVKLRNQRAPPAHHASARRKPVNFALGSYTAYLHSVDEKWHPGGQHLPSQIVLLRSDQSSGIDRAKKTHCRMEAKRQTQEPQSWQERAQATGVDLLPPGLREGPPPQPPPPPPPPESQVSNVWYLFLQATSAFYELTQVRFAEWRLQACPGCTARHRGGNHISLV